MSLLQTRVVAGVQLATIMFFAVRTPLGAQGQTFFVSDGNGGVSRIDHMDPAKFHADFWEMWYYKTGTTPNGSKDGVWGSETDRSAAAVLKQYRDAVKGEREVARDLHQDPCAQRFNYCLPLGPIAIVYKTHDWQRDLPSTAKVQSIVATRPKATNGGVAQKTGEGTSTITFGADPTGRDADVEKQFEQTAKMFRDQAADADKAGTPKLAAWARQFAVFNDCLADAARGNARTCTPPPEAPDDDAITTSSSSRTSGAPPTPRGSTSSSLAAPRSSPPPPTRVEHNELDPHSIEFAMTGREGKRVSRTLWRSGGRSYCSETLTDEPSADRPCTMADGSQPYEFGRHTVPHGSAPGVDRIIEIGQPDPHGAAVDRLVWDQNGTTYCSQTPSGRTSPESVCTYSNGARPFEFRDHATHIHRATVDAPSPEVAVEAARQRFIYEHTSLFNAATVAKSAIRHASRLAILGADWAVVATYVRQSRDLYDQMFQLFPNDRYTGDVRGALMDYLPRIRQVCGEDALRRFGAGTPTTLCNF